MRFREFTNQKTPSNLGYEEAWPRLGLEVNLGESSCCCSSWAEFKSCAEELNHRAEVKIPETGPQWSLSNTPPGSEKIG